MNIQRVTAESIYTSKPFSVGDIHYIPIRTGNGKLKANFRASEIKSILKDINPPYVIGGRVAINAEMAIRSAYEYFMFENDDEPAWIKYLNDSFKRDVRIWNVASGRSLDQLQIVFHLPFAGFGYVIESDKLIHDICDTFGIWRLGKIRQLAFLRDPSVRENNPEIMAQHFNHTRLVHSLDVAAVMGLLIRNNHSVRVNGKTIGEYGLHALTAAISHDTLTPAGGDTMKALDFEAFDEDKQYHTLFQKERWPRIRDKYKLNEQLLYATVQGQGILGQMLDIADKIAYTSRDVWEFLNTLHIQSMENRVDLSPHLMEVGNEVCDNPLITSLWQHAIVKDEKIVFDNIEAVTSFLRLRARMFKGVYANPTSRFPEYLISQFIGKKMYEQGILTKEFLLSSHDEFLEDRINTFMEIPYFTYTVMNHIPVKVTSFATNEDALSAQAKLNGSVSFIEKCESRTKSGVDSFLVLKDDKIMTIREAAPFQAEVITSILKEDTSYRLYELNLSGLSDDVKAKIMNLCKE